MNSNFTIRTLSRSINHFPMQHLFSPTALDNDLKYVDKTYYTTNTANNFISNNNDIHDDDELKIPNEKQIISSVHAIVLNRTINLVTSISRLDLRNIGLFALPTQVSLLTKLTLLDLSQNKLVKLPSSMDQLKHLRHLNLSHNCLTNLPNSIYSLTKLTHFDISYNPFTQISANLARLINLSLLDLSNTEIISIPAELLSLSMTTIKIENCKNLANEELNQSLQYEPISLLETCARQIIQPILNDLILKKSSSHSKKSNSKKSNSKKSNSKKTKQKQSNNNELPSHLLNYLSKPKACSSCGGPYFQSFIVRFRLVQRQDESWIPVEYRLCSAHWNNEKDRLLTLFSDAPNMSLPTTLEPCHLRLVA